MSPCPVERAPELRYVYACTSVGSSMRSSALDAGVGPNWDVDEVLVNNCGCRLRAV